MANKKSTKATDVSRKIYRKETIATMQAKIDLLGYKNTYDAVDFLNIRVFTSLFLFFVLIYLIDGGYLLAPICTFLYYVFLPKFTIDRKINRRREKLDSEAMYFFEVLTLSLESGRSLKNALEVTSKNIDSELSEEVRKSLDDMKYGKSLNEVLEDLKKRIPSNTINNIILNAQQSNIFGNSIIETMYNQIDYIRDKKIMETKAKISKIPVQVSVISVIFFIPLMLLMILAPVLIDYLGGI